jgi:hypothetical protein
MTVYKRGTTWWADFSIGNSRLRISLKTSDKREALRREKLRIVEAQNGRLVSTKTVGLAVPEAAAAYIARRTPLVAARTLELENWQHRAQPQEAPQVARRGLGIVLGAGGRRFKSYRPDQSSRDP